MGHKREADALFDDDQDDDEGGGGKGKGKGKAKVKRAKTAAGTGGGGGGGEGAKAKPKATAPRAVSSTVCEGGESVGWIRCVHGRVSAGRSCYASHSKHSTNQPTNRRTHIHTDPQPTNPRPTPPAHLPTCTKTTRTGDFDPEALAADYTTAAADGGGGAGGTAALGKNMHAQVCMCVCFFFLSWVCVLCGARLLPQ